MSKIKPFNEPTKEGSNDLEETVWVIAKPYMNLCKCAHLLDKETSESFNTANKAWEVASSSRKDPVLRVKALRAFAHCYSDMGLDDKAAEMTKRWKEIANDHLKL